MSTWTSSMLNLPCFQNRRWTVFQFHKDTLLKIPMRLFQANTYAYLHRGQLSLDITSQHLLTLHILAVWAEKHQRHLCSSSERQNGGRTQNTAIEGKENGREKALQRIKSPIPDKTHYWEHRQAFHDRNLTITFHTPLLLYNEPDKAQPQA